MEMIGAAHEARVDGSSMAWGELGAGPPLVLLHGVWDSHRTWRRAAPLLARHFRVLMPDLPGHGWSGRPDAPYTLSWYARMVAAWMDGIGLERAHVCGHSFGGGIAAWMLLQERSHIDRLALVAAGGLGREVGLGMRLATIPLLGPALTPLVLRFGAPLVMHFAPATFGHIEPAEAALVVSMTRLPGSVRALQRSIAGVINVFGQYQNMADRAHEVAALPPLAVYWGTKDPVIPLQHGERLLRRLTGITLTTYPECGHYPHLDAAAGFARDLSEFLCDPARPRARVLATGGDTVGDTIHGDRLAPRRVGATAAM
jgi:pimeloyl-ACP methyl ester carboxylesterase